DGTVYLLETATGRERCRFVGHDGNIYSVAFARDGKWAASAGRDGNARLWEATGRPKGARPLDTRLSAERLEKLWTELQSADVPRAFGAVLALAAAPESSVPFLRARLQPVADVSIPSADRQRIARLIAELDDDAF